MTDILSSLLAQDSAKKNNFDKVLWLVNLMKWLQRSRSENEKDTSKETVYSVRIKYILSMLSKNPEWRLNFVTTCTVMLSNISSSTQFSKVGFSNSGFIQELIHRIQEKILPKAFLTEDLENLIYEIFPDEEESLYVDFVDEVVLNELLALFNDQTELHQKLKQNILNATYILSVQILNGVFTIRNELNYDDRDMELFPEFRLEGLLRELQIKKTSYVNVDFFELISLIEKNTDELYKSMQTQGIKIELVYLFQIQKRKLNRLKILLGFLDSQTSTAINFRLFISHLILDANHHKSLVSFFAENLSLMTKRIVHANSQIGEHYVTYTWSEFRDMFASAAGGGAVTALTVFLKLALSKLGLVGFIKGLFDSLNYSGSFLLIQIMGWTLATKQPSATAPFIATELLKSTIEARRSIVALLRTQFIAVLGNLSLVFPICFFFSWLALVLNQPIMSESIAIQTYQSTNIFGPSLLFATFTGGLLFLAGLMGGLAENWIILNQISNRINYNEKIQKILGVKRTEKLAQFVSTKSNTLGANISLGFLLGMTPQIMKFFGLALDVRHVTLATGAFATSLPIILSKGVNFSELFNSVIGILFIGLVNISVSFMLAFFLASISSQVKFASFFKLFSSGMRFILIRPWLLIIPEKEKT